MNWTPDQRLAAIDIISTKLMNEPYRTEIIDGLILIRQLSWQGRTFLNDDIQQAILRSFLTNSELQKIKSC